MQEIAELQHAIETLEAQRALLGDSVVNAALASMRDRLRQLQSQAATEQRKLVTILFADLVDFTVLTRRLDAEDVREVVNVYFTRWTAAIERHNGIVEKFAGDAVMAVFGLLQSSDLDPIQAVNAALAMRRDLVLLNERLAAQYGVQLQMRTGIHTGHAIVSTLRERRGQDFVIVGDSVNLASRLQALAPLNGIVISHNTYQHVHREFTLQVLPPVLVKGFEQPIPCYSVIGERPHVARALAGVSALAPVVGREELIAALHEAWRRMHDEQMGQIIILVGEPGLGKSRLLLEFERWLHNQPAPIHLFFGRSLPALRDVPYGLLRDLFAQQLAIQDSDAPAVVERKLHGAIHSVLPAQPDASALIGRLLGFSGGDSGRELVEDPELLQNQALARLSDYFMVLAAERPVVALIEDLHWVDDSSLALLDRLTGTLGNQRLLVVCSARPELGERLPLWRKDTAHRSWIELAQLTAADCTRLLLALLEPMADVPPQLIEQVVTAADGNPFFVEELVKVLIEDGVIDATVQPWVADQARLAAARLPQTLDGVLQARLDSLPGGSRLALQQAAVIGRVFWDQALAYVQTQTPTNKEAANKEAANKEAANKEANVQQVLATLNQRELVFSRGVSSFERTQEYLFKHTLMRDVAYSSMLKRPRRLYHRLAAQWLEEITLRSGRTDEFAALIAGHYDAAGDAEQAAQWYLQAGRLAARSFANAEALRAFGRALDLLRSDLPAQRYTVLAERERVYDLLGRRSEQGGDLDQMEALAAQLGDPACQAESALRRSQLALALGEYARSLEAAQQAEILAQALPAADVEALAELQMGQIALRQGEYNTALAHTQRAWTLADRIGDRALQADSLHAQAMAQVFLGEFDAAQQSFAAALSEAVAIGNRRLECTLLNRLSWVPTSRNDFKLAIQYVEQSLLLSREIGDRVAEANALTNLGNDYIQLSDYSSGEAYSQEALALYRLLGDPAGEGAVLDNLGNAAWGQGDFVAALQYKQEALAIIRRIGDRQTETNILGNMGIVACDLGDTTAAYDYMLQALQLARSDGNRSIESTIAANLAVVCLRREDMQAALVHARAACSVAQALDAPRDLFNALDSLGAAQLALGDPAAALAAHRRQQSLAAELGLPDYAAGAAARQALAHLALGDLASAMELIEPALTVLHQLAPDSIYAPGDIFWACSQVLQAAGDSRVDAVLDMAHAWLEERLARLDSDTHRHSFIVNIPVHAALLQAWQAQRSQAAQSTPHHAGARAG